MASKASTEDVRRALTSEVTIAGRIVNRDVIAKQARQIRTSAAKAVQQKVAAYLAAKTSSSTKG
jgi:hypothetical protein